MAKRADKKQNLRDRLLAAARTQIAEKGVAALKARDVAEAAQSALGGIYTVFQDLDDVILAVNQESFEALDTIMTAAVAGVASPGDRMARLIEAYLGFAERQPNLWRAMFEHRLPPGRAFPLTHYQALDRLMQHIVRPLAELQPNETEDARMIRARTLFSAFHGVIAMSLDHRFTGVGSEALKGELQALLAQLVRGMEPSQRG